MKYYYTDPIAARYMAERYGIKYITASGDTVEIAGDGFYVGWKSLINGYKLYVAEEQHHLFKAVPGDMVMNKNGGDRIIIMRDGKHFFMPEV